MNGIRTYSAGVSSSKLPWTNRVFIVAGISGNGSIYKAKQLICAAKECGADAVKIQIFEPSDLTLDIDNPNFRIEGGVWDGTLYELYERMRTPFEWLPELKKLADSIGLVFFATIYHPSKIKIAESLNVPIYKISSFETSYNELIEEVAKLNKPVIISTGQSPFNEIREFVSIVRKYHNKLCLLKCTMPEEMNLLTIPHIARKFGVDVGLSDHTTGILAAVSAVSLGARVIEKHLCLDANCPDGEFSIMPERFETMVQVVRGAEQSLGKVWYGRKGSFKRSWVATDNITRNGSLNDSNTRFVRTVAKGRNLRGEKASRNYMAGELLDEYVPYARSEI